MDPSYGLSRIPFAQSATERAQERPMFDMKNLSKLKVLDENSPAAMKAFWAIQ